MLQPSILLVEDDAFQRKAAETYLMNHDLKVIAVENGAQMRRQISRAMPDLVLLDVQLPDIDGFQVAEQLRELADPPAVVLTSSRDSADYGRCIQGCGANGFVPKADLSGAAIAALLIA